MTAFLYDDVVAATTAPQLTVVPDLEPTPMPAPKAAKRSEFRPVGGDPLVDHGTAVAGRLEARDERLARTLELEPVRADCIEVGASREQLDLVAEMARKGRVVAADATRTDDADLQGLA